MRVDILLLKLLVGWFVCLYVCLAWGRVAGVCVHHFTRCCAAAADDAFLLYYIERVTLNRTA